MALEFYALMQDIRKDEAITLVGQPTIYKLKGSRELVRNTGVSLEQDASRALLLKLAERGAVAIEPLPRYQIVPDNLIADMPELVLDVNQYKIKLIQPEFDRQYASYEEIVEKAWPTQAPTQPDINGSVTIRLTKEGRTLFLVAPNEKVKINTFRADLPPEKLVNYLLHHRAGAVVRKSELIGGSLGLEKLDDISETLRRAGFTRRLKAIFMPVCSADKIQMLNSASIPAGELQTIINELR